jgi:hypothetical protein
MQINKLNNWIFGMIDAIICLIKMGFDDIFDITKEIL